MEKPTKVLEIFGDYAKDVDTEIKRLISDQSDLNMYGIMSYFFGYKNEDLQPVAVFAGKRFRSGLCLLLADIYGAKDKALKLASSIEIFHNFTLIHDDIEDNDPLRRGRPTVWKLWGLNHGINTGDGQLILANIEMIDGCQGLKNDFVLQRFLNEKFLEVAEGQFLDFSLTDLPINDNGVNEEKYLEMIYKKSSVLIGASTKAAGLIAGLDEVELNNLWEFGVNLGMAYQTDDDIVSIWGDPKITGKISANDIREKKKTLPIIHLFNKVGDDKKQKLTKIYNKKGNLTDAEINLFIEELDKVNAFDFAWKKLEEYKAKSITAVNKLNISESDKEMLVKVVNALLPNVKENCKC